jgi:hypothetical protein
VEDVAVRAIQAIWATGRIELSGFLAFARGQGSMTFRARWNLLKVNAKPDILLGSSTQHKKSDNWELVNGLPIFHGTRIGDPVIDHSVISRY